jgi:hypothetical protein
MPRQFLPEILSGARRLKIRGKAKKKTFFFVIVLAIGYHL